MIFFAVNMSILVINPNKIYFNININQTFLDINTWFKDNLLSLNFNKTHSLEFRVKHCCNVNTEIKCNQKYITKATMTKLLGLIIDDILTWKQHIDQIVSKMCTACCTIQNIKSLVSLDTLRIIYSVHIHSILSYGIIFWGNSSYINKIFILQKKIIRIIMNTKTRDSCRELFKDMKILPMYSRYIYSFILYTVNNKQLYNTHKEIHKYRTRYNNNLYLTIVNLSKFNKGAYFSRIKVFNRLPEHIKNLPNDQKCFITTLKRFLCQHSFYWIEEYFNYKENK